jgi:hypothetical protein
MRINFSINFSEGNYEKLKFLAEESGESIRTFLEEFVNNNLADLPSLSDNDEIYNEEDDDSENEDGLYFES